MLGAGDLQGRNTNTLVLPSGPSMKSQVLVKVPPFPLKNITVSEESPIEKYARANWDASQLVVCAQGACWIHIAPQFTPW